ncbi:MAG: hypothetical protein VXZ39_15125 [Planctomycetota bacterium]|nr:hypothetical protein [Planctomycetota bacterium]
MQHRTQHAPISVALSGGAGVLLLLLGFFVSACGGDGATDEVVVWPELAAFDEIAYVADGHARTGDLSAVASARAQLLEAGLLVTIATIPSNAADRTQAEATLGDLRSLVEGLAVDQDEEALSSLVLGMHPVIEELMKAVGMPHVHANEGPKGGFRFPVFGADGVQVGTAEIKLHDDAGDLEVWLTRGGYGGDPWRLPVGRTLALSFPDLERDVTLAVRDAERNEDESGAVTVVDGTTDYFVFPGSSDADASWLMGADFAAKVELRVEEATTGSFVLRPHVQ